MYSGGSHRKHYPSSHWKIPLLLHVDEPKARMLILASPESYIYYFRFVILCRRELGAQKLWTSLNWCRALHAVGKPN